LGLLEASGKEGALFIAFTAGSRGRLRVKKFEAKRKPKSKEREKGKQNEDIEADERRIGQPQVGAAVSICP
jgi:hypothetical protein